MHGKCYITVTMDSPSTSTIIKFPHEEFKQGRQTLKKTKQECLSALCRASFVDVYLAYLKSYGHLKMVKCIGMY